MQSNSTGAAPPNSASTKLTKQALKHLNSGFSFQYSIINHIRRSRDIPPVFKFEASEFPVEAGGKNTHVDFILRNREGNTFLVCECKNSDPQAANWMFAQAPILSNKHTTPQTDYLYVDTISRKNSLPSGPFEACAARLESRHPMHHLARAFRAPSADVDVQENGQTINQAVAQVMRGTAGVLNYISDHGIESDDSGGLQAYLAIPVIITTANLWTTDVDLSTADIHTGQIPPEGFSLTPAEFVFYQHPASDGLLTSVPRPRYPADFARDLTEYFLRTVCVTTPAGLAELLPLLYRQLSWVQPVGREWGRGSPQP